MFDFVRSTIVTLPGYHEVLHDAVSHIGNVVSFNYELHIYHTLKDIKDYYILESGRHISTPSPPPPPQF